MLSPADLKRCPYLLITLALTAHTTYLALLYQNSHQLTQDSHPELRFGTPATLLTYPTILMLAQTATSNLELPAQTVGKSLTQPKVVRPPSNLHHPCLEHSPRTLLSPSDTSPPFQPSPLTLLFSSTPSTPPIPTISSPFSPPLAQALRGDPARGAKGKRVVRLSAHDGGGQSAWPLPPHPPAPC